MIAEHDDPPTLTRAPCCGPATSAPACAIRRQRDERGLIFRLCLFLLLLNCYFSVIGPCWLPASKGSFPRLFANQKRNETGGHDRPNGSALLGTSLTGGSNLVVAVVYSNDLADSRWPTAALDRYHGAGQSGRRRRR